MDESFHDDSGLEAGLVARLSGTRRDGPGLIRLTLHTALLLGSGALLVRAAAPWEWAVGLALHAVAQLAFFAALHECAHRTAFKTDLLNQAGAWWASLTQLMAPPMFRAFHFAHHRHTHDLERDPELAGMELQARWPRGPMVLVNASGLFILFGRLAMLFGSAVGHPRLMWSRLLPWVRDNRRAGVIWGSRLLIALHAGFLALAWFVEPRLLRVYLAVPIAHALLTLYVTCEHRGLPTEGSILERTRTFDPGPLVTWWMWNMPYHAEHHAYPAVPFHALPKLHEAMRPQLVHDVGGIVGLHLRGGS